MTVRPTPLAACFLAAILIVAVAPLRTEAQVFQWSGAGASPAWSEPNNWIGGVAPQTGTGDTLYFFDSSLNQSPIQDLGSEFIADNVYVRATSPQFTLTGSPITIVNNGAFRVESPTSANSDVTVENNLHFQHGARLELSGSARAFLRGEKITSTSGSAIFVSGDGTLFLRDTNEIGNIQVTPNVNVNIYSPSTILAPNGFLIQGDVFFGETMLNLPFGGTVEGDTLIDYVDIQTGSNHSLSFNGNLMTGVEGGLVLRENAKTDGATQILFRHQSYVELHAGSVLGHNVVTSSDTSIYGSTTTERGTIDGDVYLNQSLLGNNLLISGDLIVETDSGTIYNFADVLVLGDTFVRDVFYVEGLYSCNGTVSIEPVSRVDLDNGMIQANMVVQYLARLLGEGTIVGDIVCDGFLDPKGDSFNGGTILVDGDITLGASSITEITIRGNSPDQVDLIRNAGSGANSLNLGGRLEITLSGYVPTSTDSLVISRGFFTTGHFSNAVPTSQSGPPTGTLSLATGTFLVKYDSINVTLSGFQLHPEVVAVDSVDVVRGIYRSGGLEELVESDDKDVSATRSNQNVAAVVDFEIVGSSVTSNPTSIELVVESSVFARTNVDQHVEFFNYVSNSFETVDVRSASRFADQVVITVVDTNAGAYIDPGTGELKARVSFHSTRQRQRFSAFIDQLIWNIR